MAFSSIAPASLSDMLATLPNVQGAAASNLANTITQNSFAGAQNSQKLLGMQLQNAMLQNQLPYARAIAMSKFLPAYTKYLEFVQPQTAAAQQQQIAKTPQGQQLIAGTPSLNTDYTANQIAAASGQHPELNQAQDIANDQFRQMGIGPLFGQPLPESDAQIARLKQIYGQPQQPTPQQAQTVGNALQSQAIQSTTPKDILNQQYYEAALSKQLQSAQQLLPGAVKFLGVMGQLQGNAQKAIGAVGGTNSPDYIAYNNFFNQNLPIIGNELRRAIGDNASDKTNEVIHNIVTPSYWASNPKLAMAQYQNLVNILHTNASGISMSPAQINSAVSQLSSMKAPSSPAQQLGQKLGIGAMKMPSFDNKAHFQSWYQGLNPQQQASVRAQLGGQ